jgi:hypothetical protein
MVAFEQMIDVVLDEAVRAAFDEATRADLPVCQKCLSACMARRTVLEVFPLLAAIIGGSGDSQWGGSVPYQGHGAQPRARALFCLNTRDRPGSLG